MFERFTDRARRVLVLAQEEARLLNHSFIGTEHILLGLIHEGEGVAAKALSQLGITLEDVQRRVEETDVGLSGRVAIGFGSPPFTPRAKKVMELSLREALQMGHNYISTEHLLLGLVREEEGVGVQVLTSLGADPVRVRQQVIQLLSGYVGRESASAGGGAGSSEGLNSRVRAREWLLTSGEPNPIEITGPPPEDPNAARAEIAAAFAGFGALSDDGQNALVVDGGESLGPTLVAARERHPNFIPEGADVTLWIDDVVFTDPEHAVLWFTVMADDEPRIPHQRGDAVLVAGQWKMARSTFCALMRMAGVECPPVPG